MLWTDDDTTTYFDLISKYSDKIIIEVVGHDHYSDLRYHDNSNSASSLLGTSESNHNMIVSPGVTPIDTINPGFATFEVDDSTLTPENLQLTFVELSKTYGKSLD